MAAKRCGRCGQFAHKAYPVWVNRPNPEIEYDACWKCIKELKINLYA